MIQGTSVQTMRKRQTNQADQQKAGTSYGIGQHGLPLQPAHARKQTQSKRAQSGHHEAAKAGQNTRDILCGLLRDI